MSAVAVAPVKPESSNVPTSDVEKEREVVIVDLKGDDKKTINSSTSFTVTWKDPETGVINVGTFTAQRPNLGMLGRIAVLKAKMNGGERVDADTDFGHEMMAGLQIILTAFPDWWKPDEFYDVTPLRKVWDHVRSWCDSFRKKRVG